MAFCLFTATLEKLRGRSGRRNVRSIAGDAWPLITRVLLRSSLEVVSRNSIFRANVLVWSVWYAVQVPEK